MYIIAISLIIKLIKLNKVNGIIISSDPAKGTIVDSLLL